MKNIFHTLLLSFSLLLISSCDIYKDFRKDNPQPEVRFVDMQGNPKQIDLKTPAQNIEALNRQGTLIDRKLESQPPIEPPQPKTVAHNKYANPQQNDLEKTLALPTEKPQNSTQPNNVGALESKEVIKEIEYDLAKEEIVEPAKKPAKEKIIAKKAKKKSIKRRKSSINYNIKKGYYAQVGSFKSNSHAKKQMRIVKKVTPKLARFNIQTANVKGRKYHRLLIGPYKSKNSAKSMIKKLKTKGKTAILIKVK